MANLKSEAQNVNFEDEQPKKTNNRTHYEGPTTTFAKLFYQGLCTYAHKKGWDLGPTIDIQKNFWNRKSPIEIWS